MLRILGFLFAVVVILGLGGALAGGFMLWQMSRDLPDYDHLAKYSPPIMTRMHAADGELIAEYARERRMFVPITVIPEHVINAFLAAEDKNFYKHAGIDALSILRAVVDNIINVLTDRRLVGASTITQQVAKNFLLTSDVTIERKIKEAILAQRIEKAFTKQQILELYLNEIYLGFGSYGVAAAALNYFDKPLIELTVDEAAYLAALPKAPNNYHPINYPERAVGRRNWVIGRMLENGFISSYAASVARAAPLVVTPRRRGAQIIEAEYFVEEVRRQLYEMYGEAQLYEGGLSVRTTLDTEMQAKALKALRDGLVAYDRRHGWRGPVGQMLAGQNWHMGLSEMEVPEDIAPWRLAVVLSFDSDGAIVGLRPRRLASGQYSKQIETGRLSIDDSEWARPVDAAGKLGAKPSKLSDVLAVGDVVYVEALPPVNDEGASSESENPEAYQLRQIPEVNGAIVALDPHTGRVFAIVGGFSFDKSEFNRATQAKRQPGSAFKPFVYAAALDRGFTPSSLVLDAPFVMDQGPGLAMWKPENYGRKFYGPSTLRLGIEKSRNVMTVRLAQSIGMDPIVEQARRFGIVDDMPAVLSMSLGAGETTLLRLTTAYGMLVNGGKKIEPTLIDRIQDRNGKTIYRFDQRPCAGCSDAEWHGQPEPQLPDDRDQVISPQTAYQSVSMLEGVVQRGTARSVRAVGVPLAGKTGTTNEERDAWFVGFSPDLAVGVFVGFDSPLPLGKKETGGRVAAPIFRDFMKAVIGDKPAVPFRIPPAITHVRVDAKTGLVARAGDEDVILEAFRVGTEPTISAASVPSGAVAPETQGPAAEGASQPAGSLATGTGGLY